MDIPSSCVLGFILHSNIKQKGITSAFILLNTRELNFMDVHNFSWIQGKL